MPEPILNNYALSHGLYTLSESLSLEEIEGMPLLKPIAEACRKRFAANKIPRDIELQNQQEYNAFIAACKDIVFLLTVSNQYYLLSKLFQSPDLKVKWLRFIEKIREHQNQKNMGEIQIKKTPANLASNYESKSSFNWTHPDPNLSNIGRYIHYQNELQRITYNYHSNTVQIYNNSFNSRLSNLNAVIGILKATVPTDVTAINEVQTIQEDFIAKRQLITDTPVLNSNGNLNLTAATQQRKDLEKLDIDFFHKVQSSLGKLGLNNIKINEILLKDQDAFRISEAQIKAITDEYNQQKQELMPYLEKERQAALKDANKHLHSIMNDIKMTPTVGINKAQIEAMDADIQNLSRYMDELQETKDSDSMQECLGKCLAEIQKIEKIIKPILPADNSKIFDGKINELREMVTASGNIERKGAQKDAQGDSTFLQHKNIATNAIFEDNNQIVVDNISVIDTLQSKSNPYILKAPTPFRQPAYNPEVIPAPIIQPPFNPEALDLKKIEPSNNNNTELLDKQLNFKKSVQSLRDNNQNGTRQSNKTNDNAEDSEIISLSGDEKNMIESIIEGIPSLIKQTINSESFNEDDSEKIILIKEIQVMLHKQLLKYEIDRSKIKSLVDAIDSLENGAEFLKDATEELKSSYNSSNSIHTL